ncbi:hypothetical protein HYDPIDRAFT_119747 [Hydnomerulius pinastri MD-312]|uniref:Uncharacterized protein n=1 Tax=Hydnomerulius pinastri MD-312 TaxID=994086 RepID=A0A0C9UZ10_9AGAM|nr:hypothetical protein HYDPIDRAFT_119747 [Hydnomerulius pinastri MD-312]
MAPAPRLTFLPITLIRDIPCATHNHSELCAMKVHVSTRHPHSRMNGIMQPQPHIIWIDTTVVLLPPTITNLLATINGIYAAAIDDM